MVRNFTPKLDVGSRSALFYARNVEDFVNKVKQKYEERSQEYIDLKNIEDLNDCWIIELCLKKEVCFELVATIVVAVVEKRKS